MPLRHAFMLSCESLCICQLIFTYIWLVVFTNSWFIVNVVDALVISIIWHTNFEEEIWACAKSWKLCTLPVITTMVYTSWCILAHGMSDILHIILTTSFVTSISLLRDLSISYVMYHSWPVIFWYLLSLLGTLWFTCCKNIL